MTAKTQRVLKEAMRLPPNARASVAGRLILSLETGAPGDVEEAWEAEIDRRLDNLERSKARAVSWEDVKARILSSRRGRLRP